MKLDQQWDSEFLCNLKKTLWVVKVKGLSLFFFIRVETGKVFKEFLLIWNFQFIHVLIVYVSCR